MKCFSFIPLERDIEQSTSRIEFRSYNVASTSNTISGHHMADIRVFDVFFRDCQPKIGTSNEVVDTSFLNIFR